MAVDLPEFDPMGFHDRSLRLKRDLFRLAGVDGILDEELNSYDPVFSQQKNMCVLKSFHAAAPSREIMSRNEAVQIQKPQAWNELKAAVAMYFPKMKKPA